MGSQTFNGHSMVGTLERVLVCSPHTAGWNDPTMAARWKELGFLHPPDFTQAQAQHEAACHQLEAAGAEVIHLTPSPDLSLDAAFPHDASFPTDHGLIVLNPGKANRRAEAARHRDFCQGLGIPVLREITAPATAEGGDLVWLDSRTLLVGHGYRTNAAGIEQLRGLLAPTGVEVIAAPLVHYEGAGFCLHLMSLMSMLDEETVLVDLPLLAVETVELLHSRGLRLVEIDREERLTQACNVLSLGRRRLLAIEQNQRTNRRLQQFGFDVRTFPGGELCLNGGGGPTCLTRPLLRD